MVWCAVQWQQPRFPRLTALAAADSGLALQQLHSLQYSSAAVRPGRITQQSLRLCCTQSLVHTAPLLFTYSLVHLYCPVTYSRSNTLVHKYIFAHATLYTMHCVTQTRAHTLVLYVTYSLGQGHLIVHIRTLSHTILRTLYMVLHCCMRKLVLVQ